MYAVPVRALDGAELVAKTSSPFNGPTKTIGLLVMKAHRPIVVECGLRFNDAAGIIVLGL